MGAELWQNGSGGVFSGPMVMGFADTTMYGCVLAALGPGFRSIDVRLFGRKRIDIRNR